MLSPGFVEGLAELSLAELRARRDDCLAEREYLSLLRRLVQGRAEILAAELEARRGAERGTEPLVERLARVLAPDEPRGPSRGEAVRIAVPEPEVLAARRRVERLVADAGLSDPTALSDADLERAIATLEAEEREVSRQRAAVITVLDTLQEELRRRYRQDLSQVLS